MPRTVLSTGCKIMNVYKNVCVFICREIPMHIYGDMYECTYTYVLIMKRHTQRKKTVRNTK